MEVVSNRMELVMKGNGRIINQMGKALKDSQISLATRDCSSRDLNRVRELLLSRMADFIREILLMIRSRERELTNGQMVSSMKVNGKTTARMGKVL